MAARQYMLNLSLGSRGDEVARWQNFLVSKGYRVVVDGAFGPRTEAATKMWQISVGLIPDGIVGPKSRAAAWPRIPELGFVNASLLEPVYDRAGKRVGLLRRDAAESYNSMVKAAAMYGVDLRPTSAGDTYRGPDVYESTEVQRKIRLGIVAPPGRSRHNQGIAVDFRDTPGAYLWLRENGAQFGWWWGERRDEPWHWCFDPALSRM